MHRLLSPSALFAMWTLLFGLPVLALAVHHPQLERSALLRRQHENPGAADAYRRLSGWTRPIAAVIRFVPISYPLFAIVFAMWPRVMGRSLQADLGRWQFALATLPLFLIPLLATSVAISLTAASGAPIVFHRAPPPLFSATIFGSMVAIFVLWLVSLGIFALNVARTNAEPSNRRSPANP